MNEEQEQNLHSAKRRFKPGDTFCPPPETWSYMSKGEYTVSSPSLYKVDHRGVWCGTNKGDTWLLFKGVWATKLSTVEREQALELKGLYRKRIQELTDEITALKYENEQLKRQSVR